jgi:hypothetical protein
LTILIIVLGGVMVVTPVVLGIVWLFWMDQRWQPIAYALTVIFVVGIFILPLIVLMISSDEKTK